MTITERFPQIDTFLDEKGRTVKVGDISTAYMPGFHKVLAIFDRSWKGEGDPPRFGGYNKSPLIHYTQIFTGKNKPVSTKRIDSYDAAYCLLVDQNTIEEKIKEHEQIIDNFKQFQIKHNIFNATDPTN